MFFNANVNMRFVKKLMGGASMGALAAVMVNPAQAQEVQTEVVTSTATGTSIKGIAPVGTNLITVDATAIKATGAVTTEEVLSQIPQLANTFNTQTVSPTAINIGGVRPSIRYNPAQTILGTSSTLLLLDGHNMPAPRPWRRSRATPRWCWACKPKASMLPLRRTIAGRPRA